MNFEKQFEYELTMGAISGMKGLIDHDDLSLDNFWRNLRNIENVMTNDHPYQKKVATEFLAIYTDENLTMSEADKLLLPLIGKMATILQEIA